MQDVKIAEGQVEAAPPCSPAPSMILSAQGNLELTQLAHWCPHSQESSCSVLCQTQVGSHSVSVTPLPD